MNKKASLYALMRRSHLKAIRMFGYTLTLSTSQAWDGLSFAFAAHLSIEERVALAWSVLRTLSDAHIGKVVETVAGTSGGPLPPFMTPMDDAQWWAKIASRNELKAYCLAAFENLPARDQAAFLHYVNHKEAA